jgi:DnaK suppressor protein
MTETELKKYKRILEVEAAILGLSVSNREGISAQREPGDLIDDVMSAIERSVAIGNIDRDSNMLRLIRHALIRINGGDYGVCSECEEDIPTKRLDALPWAALCIRCQQLKEKNTVQENEVDELQSAA